MTNAKRYYKLNHNLYGQEAINFFSEIAATTTKAAYFRAGIGVMYLSVTGAEEPGDTEGITTAEDVLHKYRKLIDSKIRLAGKPSVSKTWKGDWTTIK